MKSDKIDLTGKDGISKRMEEELTELNGKLDKDVMKQMRDELKAELIQEFKDDTVREREELVARREEEKSAHLEYVDQMKNSTEPWVDIQGWVQTDQGIRAELDWNDALVKHLKSEGVSGADDEEVVQRWVTLLLRDMADRMDGEKVDEDGSKFS